MATSASRPAKSAVHGGKAAGKRRTRSGGTLTSDRDFARHIIEFDADNPKTYGPQTLPAAAIMRAVARSPIPWPTGKAPVPRPLAAAPSPGAPLPQCDYLIVTWTVEEPDVSPIR